MEDSKIDFNKELKLKEKAEKNITQQAIETKRCPNCGFQISDTDIYRIKKGKDTLCKNCRITIKGRIDEEERKFKEEEELEKHIEKRKQKELERRKKYSKGEKTKKWLKTLSIFISFLLVTIAYFYIFPHISTLYGNYNYLNLITVIILTAIGILMSIPIIIKSIKYRIKVERAVTKFIKSATLITDEFIADKLNLSLWEVTGIFKKLANKNGILLQLSKIPTFINSYYIEQFAYLYDIYGNIGEISKTLAQMYPFALSKEDLRQVLDELIYLNDLFKLKFDNTLSKPIKKIIYINRYNKKVREIAPKIYESAVKWSKKDDKIPETQKILLQEIKEISTPNLEELFANNNGMKVIKAISTNGKQTPIQVAKSANLSTKNTEKILNWLTAWNFLQLSIENNQPTYSYNNTFPQLYSLAKYWNEASPKNQLEIWEIFTSKIQVKLFRLLIKEKSANGVNLTQFAQKTSFTKKKCQKELNKLYAKNIIHKEKLNYYKLKSSEKYTRLLKNLFETWKNS